jgi:hypothetical protein
MAFRFEAASPGVPWCTLHLSGLITADDLREMVRTQIDQGAWADAALIDTTDAVGMRQGFNDLTEQVRYIRLLSEGLPARGPVAILAPADDIFGVSRMYQVAQDSVLALRLEVFRTRPEAEAFLRQARPR